MAADETDPPKPEKDGGDPKAEKEFGIRLRPSAWQLPGAEVSPAAEELEYRGCSAALEMRLSEGIESWVHSFRDCPRAIARTRSMLRRRAVEVRARTALMNPIYEYLHDETENFTAILVNRGVIGSVGVAALRAHMDEAIMAARYRFGAALVQVGFSDQAIVKWWPGSDLNRVLTADYEKVLREAEFDIVGALTRWRDLTDDPRWSYGPTVVAEPQVAERAQDAHQSEPRAKAATAGGRPRSMVDGKKLRDLRAHKGSTQAMVARLTGLSRHAIIRAEKGRASSGTVDALVKYFRKIGHNIRANDIKIKAKNALH